jgi:hypothetical protein
MSNIDNWIISVQSFPMTPEQRKARRKKAWDEAKRRAEAEPPWRTLLRLPWLVLKTIWWVGEFGWQVIRRSRVLGPAMHKAAVNHYAEEREEKAKEAERKDRIRNPDKYQGK